ncbi:MAG: hypothetical protein WD063_15300 [Pirellulales bacterium]
MATTSTSAKQSRKNRASLASGPGGPWSGQAPRRVRQAYEGDANEQGWALWCRHLARRKLRPISKLFQGRQSPLVWALPPGVDAEQAERVIELLRRPRLADRRTAGLDNAALCWLSRADVAEPDAGFALECLAWCAALPSLAEYTGERAWWQLANRLVAIAAAESGREDPLVAQLLHGELPTMLACQLPELAACRALAAVSRRTLEESTRLLDDEAMVHGSRLDALRPLLACWTRWRVIDQELDASVWSDATPRRYARLVEHVLRLSRPDRTQLFSPPEAPPWNRRLVKTALRLVDSAKTRRIARLIASGGKGSRNPRRRVPSPSFDIESAGIAVLSCDWRRRSPRLAVNYSGPQLVMELSLGRECLWTGPAEIQVRIDGWPVVPRQGWEQVCWESDRDVDYLELELRLSEDISIQRHLALAREAGFLLLADAVLGVCPRKIEYRARLPLADGTTFRAERETREGTLAVRGRPRARVLPLALSEWRSGPSCGTLGAAGGPLELAQEAAGQCLFAPLFIDFDSRRLVRQATWRQLTVGEDRQVVSRDVAVGYRVQIGKSQWLVYRSLAEPGVRTVLGKNLMHEFLLGRFGSNGKVKTIVEIES